MWSRQPTVDIAASLLTAYNEQLAAVEAEMDGLLALSPSACSSAFAFKSVMVAMSSRGQAVTTSDSFSV